MTMKKYKINIMDYQNQINDIDEISKRQIKKQFEEAKKAENDRRKGLISINKNYFSIITKSK